MAKPHVGDHREPAQQDDFVAPVKLAGFPGAKLSAT
jgi:hypothetical protein